MSLDNPEKLSERPIIDNQAIITDFHRHRTEHDNGIRVLVLKRNKFTDGFAKLLAKVLYKDKYMKKVDISGNYVKEHGLQTIVKEGLLVNESVLCFDARLNPGCSERVQRQLALMSVKNIERMRANKLSIRKEWLVP